MFVLVVSLCRFAFVTSTLLVLVGVLLLSIPLSLMLLLLIPFDLLPSIPQCIVDVHGNPLITMLLDVFVCLSNLLPKPMGYSIQLSNRLGVPPIAVMPSVVLSIAVESSVVLVPSLFVPVRLVWSTVRLNRLLLMAIVMSMK